MNRAQAAKNGRPRPVRLFHSQQKWQNFLSLVENISLALLWSRLLIGNQLVYTGDSYDAGDEFIYKRNQRFDLTRSLLQGLNSKSKLQIYML